MSSVHLGGDITSALTHFAAYGLANIVAAQCHTTARIAWTTPTPDQPPRVEVRADHVDDPRDFADAVHTHAARCAAAGSWMAAPITVGAGKPRAAMNPLIKVSDWQTLHTVRRTVIDDLAAEPQSELDLRMIGTLGEPAYWQEDRPFRGGTRWNMKTRNGGGDFVSGQLLELAKIVADRTPEAILDGLCGSRPVVDELGARRGKVHLSHTATGFTPPGPTDNATAWCAMWGITNFPLAQHLHGLAGTPCAAPATQTVPDIMALPITTRPVTAARMRTLLISRQMSVLTHHLHGAPTDPLPLTAAHHWLTARGVAAIAVFPIHLDTTVNAPPTTIGDATIHPLSDTKP